MYKILVLNLGSTSTKVAYYEDESCVKETTLRHDAQALAPFERVLDQVTFRKETVEAWCASQGIDLAKLSLFCVRGGLVKPIPSGVYKIVSTMIDELKAETYGSHVSNVGMLIGYAWAKSYGLEAVFVNAPVTDELSNLARLSGIKGLMRRSIFHALNHKQIALEYAQSQNKSLDALNLVVVHMGGGITIAAHRQGRIIDVNNAIDGEGPMTPERAGALSALMAIELYEQVGHDLVKFKKALAGKGGFMSHLQQNDMQAILQLAKTDPNVMELVDAMVYQIVKEIGAMSVVVGQPIEAILLTGGLAYSDLITTKIRQQVEWIAPVFVHPGEDELKALAMGALRYLKGEESLKSYE